MSQPILMSLFYEGKQEEKAAEVVVEQRPASEPVVLPASFSSQFMSMAVKRQMLLRLAMKGVNAKKAAEVVGCGVESIRAIYRDPAFRAEVYTKINDAFGDVDDAFVQDKKSLHEMLDAQAERSFHDLVNMLESDELMPSLRVRINQDFLNRSQQTMQQAQMNHVRLSPEQLQRAASVAREMDVVPINSKKAS